MHTRKIIGCGIAVIAAFTLAVAFTACDDGNTGGGGGGGGDLQKWTAVADSTFGTSGIGAIAYGNNKFVAGGERGKIATSSDGATWTAVADSTFGTSGIGAIAYGNNKFVAVGSQGKMAYSDDNGESWTAVVDSKFPATYSDYSIPYSISAIAYGNNKFVAGGNEGKMAYSTDNGVTWTAVEDSTVWSYVVSGNTSYSGILGIAYGNGRFVAVGSQGKMAYSTDGVTWTAVANSTFTSAIYAIAYGNNKWVAGGYYYNGIMAYSTDNGVTWTAVADSTIWQYTDSSGNTGTATIYDIAYGNNRFVAVGDHGKIAYSPDGTTWTAVADSTFPSGGTSYSYYYISGIAYGGGKFVAGGDEGKMAYADW